MYFNFVNNILVFYYEFVNIYIHSAICFSKKEVFGNLKIKKHLNAASPNKKTKKIKAQPIPLSSLLYLWYGPHMSVAPSSLSFSRFSVRCTHRHATPPRPSSPRAWLLKCSTTAESVPLSLPLAASIHFLSPPRGAINGRGHLRTPSRRPFPLPSSYKS